jgi:hypothetical protein
MHKISFFYGIQNMVAEADLEGACGACAPLKFAKHVLYNVKGASATILTKKLYVLEIGK